MEMPMVLLMFHLVMIRQSKIYLVRTQTKQQIDSNKTLMIQFIYVMTESHKLVLHFAWNQFYEIKWFVVGLHK